MTAWICHKLFGWRYWAFEYSYSTVVRRERRYLDGTPYCVASGTHFIISSKSNRKFKRVY